jgi:hypothetical protein
MLPDFAPHLWSNSAHVSLCSDIAGTIVVFAHWREAIKGPIWIFASWIFPCHLNSLLYSAEAPPPNARNNFCLKLVENARLHISFLIQRIRCETRSEILAWTQYEWGSWVKMVVPHSLTFYWSSSLNTRRPIFPRLLERILTSDAISLLLGSRSEWHEFLRSPARLWISGFPNTIEITFGDSPVCAGGLLLKKIKEMSFSEINLSPAISSTGSSLESDQISTEKVRGGWVQSESLPVERGAHISRLRYIT